MPGNPALLGVKPTNNKVVALKSNLSAKIRVIMKVTDLVGLSMGSERHVVNLPMSSFTARSPEGVSWRLVGWMTQLAGWRLAISF